ncbi:GntR family transcriptional regulator [Tanticharoenia sakaeratensis]|jgi:DNA-binding GntR family transcriptional regulator|uniref:HTH-type transcriptional regulator ydhC n=1 Tax=Tanticharoenia sakaeratensis NBRC 103193 TaxID=1231623 RepID=A0A0D6MM14_9PROT|nr:GntR family transcriptional regulator [Tanticharoenia sakaeratensis]GAN54486.1 HTH-type transcriptional regulator ydhC [Tanticharoenia sakaeratensis NBRC 103193]GBQ24257.1 transcriptional regulator [Tanticharoenia sakaeratensis NBRC 103193]
MTDTTEAATPRRRSPRPTLATQVRDRLLADIAKGVFPPGARLEEEDLAGRYSVSRTPVREALRQLSHTGTVEIRARQGVLVASLAPETMEQTLEVLADLEASSARLAAVRMSADAHRTLRETHEEMAHVIARRNRAGFDIINSTFHNLIHAGSANTILAETISQMRRRMLPYTQAQRMASPQPMAVSFQEHATILRAIERRQADLAYRAMQAHVLDAGHVPEDADARAAAFS